MARQVDFGMRDHLLYELARDLSSSLDLDVVLRKVMDRVITLMKAARGFIVLVDPVVGTMSVRMSGGEADLEKSRHFLGSRTVIEQVVRTGQAVVATDATSAWPRAVSCVTTSVGVAPAAYRETFGAAS